MEPRILDEAIDASIPAPTSTARASTPRRMSDGERFGECLRHVKGHLTVHILRPSGYCNPWMYIVSIRGENDVVHINM
jgi:hypothetical protein